MFNFLILIYHISRMGMLADLRDVYVILNLVQDLVNYRGIE